MPGLQIGFLYNHDWGHEFAGVAAGEVPTHRLFGAAELGERGHTVHHLTRAGRRSRVDWRVAQAAWVLRHQRRLDVVVATHEAAALPSLLLARLGLVRVPVVVLTVAAEQACASGRKGSVYQQALPAASAVLTYASSQLPGLRRLVGSPDRVGWLPLGVDTDFFTLSQVPRMSTVLSVGTNEGKDFPTLVAALPDGQECTIVTDATNEAQARATPSGGVLTYRSAVPITELRGMYAECAVQAIPLREASLSSGQTVLLENLASGTPVVVSDVAAIQDYVDGAPDGVLERVPPGDVEAFAAALASRLSPSARADGSDDAEAHKRRAWVDGRFDARTSAAALETVLIDVVGRSGRRPR